MTPLTLAFVTNDSPPNAVPPSANPIPRRRSCSTSSISCSLILLDSSSQFIYNHSWVHGSGSAAYRSCFALLNYYPSDIFLPETSGR
ncbi:hypothetical protein BN903_46 [Halorubrum sp. AJ67]|nr:hypothetical protein BN903_46 [Halorubrum sp. AJ67]